MAIDKAVDSARLDGAIGATAEKIREKTGASAKIAWDEEKGFADAVGAIQAGGGGGTDDLLHLMVSGQEFSYVDDETTGLFDYAFSRSAITSIRMSNLTSIAQNVFYSCKKLISVDLPNLPYRVEPSTFHDCTRLKNVNLPKVGTICRQAFRNCSALESLNLPLAKSLDNAEQFNGCSSLKNVYWPNMYISGTGHGGVFANCTSLQTLDLNNSSALTHSFFQNDKSLQAVILRRETGVVTLAGTGAFSGTPLAGIDGTYSGHVYVPSALIESYKTATNWSTLYAAYPEIFQPIEGSEYE